MLTRCWIYESWEGTPVVVHDEALVRALDAAVNHDGVKMVEAREAWDYIPDGAETPTDGTCQIIERFDQPPVVLHDDALVRALMRAINTEGIELIEPRKAVDYRPSAKPARRAWTGALDDGR